MNDLPLCRKVAYEPQAVIEGQGCFYNHRLYCLSCELYTKSPKVCDVLGFLVLSPSKTSNCGTYRLYIEWGITNGLILTVLMLISV